MKIIDITNTNVEQLQLQRPEAVAPGGGKPSASPENLSSDIIHLSPKARLMQKASQIIAATPEVRPEKVAPLQEAVSQGTYRVDSTEVAKSLLAHHLTET